MKMRPFLLTVILLAGTNTSLMGAAACCKCIPIKQKCKNNIPTPTVFPISNSGNYALTGDFKGQIVITASDVTLDLCSFKVFGVDPTTAAISAKGNNITIKNGSVTNPSGLGIEILGSTGSLVENIDIYGSNRALALVGCKSSQVNFLNVYQNNNTSSAVILVRGGESIQLSNVQANNNTKELKASIGNTDPGIGVISVFNSSNVTLTNCTANFNTRRNDNSLFAPLAALFSKSVTFINCQANDNNIRIESDTRGFAPIFLLACIDTVMDGCQADRNKLTTTTAFLRVIYSLGSSRTVIKNSQANDNHVALLIASSTTKANQDLSGIMVFALPSSPSLQSSDIVITHCQVSGNLVDDGGNDSFGSTTLGLLNGIYILGNSDATASGNFKNRSLIEYCQINDNSMGTKNNNQIVAGINVTASEDVTIANSSANGQTGGFTVIGIAVTSGPNALIGIDTVAIGACRNIKIVNSTANNNGQAGIAFGIAFAGSSNAPIQSSEIVGCQANSNFFGTSADTAVGIGLSNALSCSIIDCQTDANTNGEGSGIGDGIGTSFFSQTNKDCTILNCSAKENGDNGFELGSSNNFLVKDNIAIGNAFSGFVDGSNPFTSRYLGNYADNGVGNNYKIQSGVIQIFTLDSTGTYTPQSGDPGHFSALINVQAQ